MFFFLCAFIGFIAHFAYGFVQPAMLFLPLYAGSVWVSMVAAVGAGLVLRLVKIALS